MRIYKDNFHNTNEGGETTYNQPTPDASASNVGARPLLSPPVTRWSIAADLNGIATRARQRHQPTGSNVFLLGGSQILAQTSLNNATTTECDLPQPSIASISSVEPLADIVRALQNSVSAMTTQMREIIAARHPSDGPGTGRASTTPLSPLTLAARTDVDTPAAMGMSVPPRRNGTYTLTTAMTSIERAMEKSLRSEPAFADSYRWPCSTSGIPSENLPDVETVSPALRSAILEDKDVNLASLLILHFDLGEYSRYAGVDGFEHLLRPLSSDPRLNCNLTLPEFICGFNRYCNIMCEVWDRRKELDAYEAIVVGIASWIDGTTVYEYHRSFSARAAVLIQQQNVKVDWGVRDNGLFCSLFVGQKANVCSLCGSVAHYHPLLDSTF